MKYPALVFALSVAVLSACTTSGGGSGQAMERGEPRARATLLAGDASPRGDATVAEAADGLHVKVHARGLTPGTHAVHIHMTGICTPPDFASAGGHWNPTGRKHGKDNPQGMHMGDMPNMLAGSDGTGEMEFVIPGGTIRSGPNPLLDSDGAAIVIHAQADDNRTDPAGNAGGRIACGVLSAG